jgi:hypothetical protein
MPLYFFSIALFKVIFSWQSCQIQGAWRLGLATMPATATRHLFFLNSGQCGD